MQRLWEWWLAPHWSVSAVMNACLQYVLGSNSVLHVICLYHMINRWLSTPQRKPYSFRWALSVCWRRLHSTVCSIYRGKKSWRTSQHHRTSGFLMMKVMGWENRCPGPKLSLSRIISSTDAQDWIPLVDNQQDGHTKSALAVSAFWRFCIFDEILRSFWEKTFFSTSLKKKKKGVGVGGRRRNRWFLLWKKSPRQKSICSEISLNISVVYPLSAWFQTWHASILLPEVYDIARHRGLTSHSLSARNKLKAVPCKEEKVLVNVSKSSYEGWVRTKNPSLI